MCLIILILPLIYLKFTENLYSCGNSNGKSIMALQRAVKSLICGIYLDLLVLPIIGDANNVDYYVRTQHCYSCLFKMDLFPQTIPIDTLQTGSLCRCFIIFYKQNLYVNEMKNEKKSDMPVLVWILITRWRSKSAKIILFIDYGFRKIRHRYKQKIEHMQKQIFSMFETVTKEHMGVYKYLLFAISLLYNTYKQQIAFGWGSFYTLSRWILWRCST